MAEWQKEQDGKNGLKLPAPMEQISTQLVKIRVKTQLLCCNLIPRKIFQKEKSAIQRVVIHSGKNQWQKYYISLDNPTEVTHKVNIDAEVDWVTGYLRGGYYHGELELSEEDYKTFKKDPLNFQKIILIYGQIGHLK